jgi:hypothetical protein
MATLMRFTMRNTKFLALIPALMFCLGAAPTLSQAAVIVGVSVNFAPPVLPVYEQPPLPEPGYLWSPGYWAWDGSDYYWVPGTWVEPPSDGMLWTPGYWGWQDGLYVWNEGYWGPTVGFYGGVNYGFGYTGVGYQGGYWHGGAFFYNRSVANFGNVNIVNVYNAPVQVHETTRVSFNGGQGGLRAQPSVDERRAMSEHHIAPTGMQMQQMQRARSMPELHAKQNGGRPQVLTTARAGDFSHPGPGAGLHNHPQNQDHGAGPQLHQGPPSQSAGAGPAMRGPEHREDGAGPAMRGGPPPQSREQTQPRDQVQPHDQVQQREAVQHEQAPRPQEGRPPEARPQEHAQPKHEEPKHDSDDKKDH